MNLYLRMPLIYEKIDKMPPIMPENEEFILCFEINSAQSRCIEPFKEKFLGNLIFTGKINQSQDSTSEFSRVYLPAGHYLFTQHRGDNVLTRDEWLDLAIELHKDGLWERNKLDDLLYVRFLHEDNIFVTQIFRPARKTVKPVK